MNAIFFLRSVRMGFTAAVISAMFAGPALGVSTSGTVKLTATINDITTSSGTVHNCVVWVATGTGTFIKTLWKQGNDNWDHFDTWNNVRNGNSTVDGYTSATATSYTATNPSPPISGIASNPITVTWDGLDASNTLVADGTYQFFIQYAEQGTAQGPSTSPALLNWTKGPQASSQTAIYQSPNFAAMSIVWTPAGTSLPVIVVEQLAGTALVSGTSEVKFGSSPVGTAVAPLTFTIRNSGTASLTGIAITKTGANEVDFTVTTPVATTVAAGSRTTFTVAFKPTAEGARTAVMHIASNDTTQNPFDITLSGIGTLQPIITVEQPVGNPLVSGTGTVDFDSSPVGTAVAPLTFTIKNSGTAVLTGIAITKTGANGADFTVTPPVATTVATNDSTTFTVAFTPSAYGTRSAVLHIASNDTAHSPFDINLSGNGIAPVISVEQPTGITLVSGTSTVNFGSKPVGTPTTRTFTIKNTGSASLTGIDVTKTVGSAADFTVTPPAVTTVDAGGNTTFTVTFNPSAGGLSNAALQITSNDAAHSPFNIALIGTGTLVAVPEIAIEQPAGTALVSDTSTASFGTSIVGKAAPLTFTIRNIGAAGLTNIAATLGGTNAPEFKVTAKPPKSLAAGSSTTFTVTFTPKAIGTRTAVLHIASNDVAARNPFNINLTGDGGVDDTSPAITVAKVVTTVSTPISSGDTDNYDTLAIKNEAEFKYTISNASTAKGSFGLLKIKSVTLRTVPDVLGVKSFHIDQQPHKTLMPGDPPEKTTLRVHFYPTNEGNKGADLTITSNDPDDSPFVIHLTGKTTRTYDPDTYEDDNTAADARDISNGVIQTHNIDESRDVDWTTFTIPDGATATDVVIATYDHKGVIRFTLYKEGPVSALTIYPGRKNVNNGNRWNTYASLDPGTYYIKVQTASRDDTLADYTLTARWTENTVPTGLAPSGRLAESSMSVPAVGAAAVVADVASDGLPLFFRQRIVDALSNDGIAKPADVLPLDDFDHDGINNLLEYAMGGNPVLPDGMQARPQAVTASVNGQVYPAVSFRRLKVSGSIQYGVEESSDMTGWQALSQPWPRVGDPVDEGNGYERVTVPASSPLGAAGPRFLRVTVIGGP